jgi:hypothetical protein
MTDGLGFRAEIANQVARRLERMSDDDWSVVLVRAAMSVDFVTMAHRLALSAINVLEEEHGAEARRLVQAGLQDLASRFPLTTDRSATEVSRATLAEGLFLCAVLRDSRGFNLGAFRELSRPFHGVVDVDEAERTARAMMQVDAADFSSVSAPRRPQPEPSEPKASDAKSA